MIVEGSRNGSIHVGVRSMSANVIVEGAGLAGMMAALAAEQAGADVVLFDRGPIGVGTNSALSNAAFSGPISAERAEEYVDLVLQIGKRLNRVSSVRRIAREASAASGNVSPSPPSGSPAAPGETLFLLN